MSLRKNLSDDEFNPGNAAPLSQRSSSVECKRSNGLSKEMDLQACRICKGFPGSCPWRSSSKRGSRRSSRASLDIPVGNCALVENERRFLRFFGIHPTSVHKNIFYLTWCSNVNAKR